MAEILLARPQQAYRLVDGLGQHHGLGHVIVIEPAAVTTADAGHLDVDLGGGEAGQALHHGPGFLRSLGRHDEAGVILVQPHQAIHRFGSGVSQPRLEVGGVQPARGLLAGGVDVAVVAHAASWIGLAGEQGAGLLLQCVAALAAAGTGFPFELEFLAALQCRPGVLGEYGHGRRDHRIAPRLARFGCELQHLHHALDRERGRAVDMRQRAVRPWAMHQHGDQCIRVVLVDGVTGESGHDAVCVDIAHRFADQVIVRGILQRRQGGGQGDLAGVRRQIAIAEAAAIPCDHHAGIATQLIARHAEPSCRCLQQQPARYRADLAQIVPGGGNRPADAADLAPVGPARLAIVAGHAEAERHHADARPVGVEFVGDDPRQRRGHAGAGVRVTRADQHVALGIDAHVRAEVVEVVAEQGQRKRRIGRVGQADANYQCAGGAGHDLQEATARQPEAVVRRDEIVAHALPALPALPAATRLIARRTRVWQPQRHRLGSRSISSSPGCGLRRSSSTAAISQPGVQ